MVDSCFLCGFLYVGSLSSGSFCPCLSHSTSRQHNLPYRLAAYEDSPLSIYVKRSTGHTRTHTPTENNTVYICRCVISVISIMRVPTATLSAGLLSPSYCQHQLPNGIATHKDIPPSCIIVWIFFFFLCVCIPLLSRQGQSALAFCTSLYYQHLLLPHKLAAYEDSTPYICYYVLSVITSMRVPEAIFQAETVWTCLLYSRS